MGIDFRDRQSQARKLRSVQVGRNAEVSLQLTQPAHRRGVAAAHRVFKVPQNSLRCVEIVVGMVGGNRKVVRAEKVPAKQSARQLEPKTVIEPAVTGVKFRFAVAEQVISAAQARSDLFAPT